MEFLPILSGIFKRLEVPTLTAKGRHPTYYRMDILSLAVGIGLFIKRHANHACLSLEDVVNEID